jgi:hypothetical protein
LDKNDQSHGLLIHYSALKWDLAVHGLAGNLSQMAVLRQKGAAASVEVETADKLRLGASTLSTQNTYRKRQVEAVHARMGIPDGSSILAETGLINESPQSSKSLLGAYSLLQTTSRLTRGLNLLLTFEYYSEEAFRQTPRNYRVGPSIQYLLMQRLEIRSDIQAARVTGQSTVNPDVITWMTQVHVWL